MSSEALWSCILARFPRSRLGRAIVTLASGTIVAQLIGVCVLPIVTRLYTPAQIGVISLFVAFFGFWSPTLSLRYESALLIATDVAESQVIQRLAVCTVVVMSLVGAPVLWILRHSDVLGFALLPNWTPPVAVPIFLGYGLFMVYRTWALRAGTVEAITRATVTRAGWSATTRIILGLFGGGIPALFAAQVVSVWAAFVTLRKRQSAHYVVSAPRSFSYRQLGSVGRRYIKFPLFEAPSAWVDQAAAILPIPMIAASFGASAAGWYGLARTIVGIPNTQIGAAVADAFQMEIATAVVTGDVSHARALFFSLMRKLAFFGFVPMAGIATLCPLLVPWIFGDAWREAGYAAAIIAPWLYIALIVSPLSRVLSVLQVQEYKLIYDVAAITLLILAFVTSKQLDLTFLQLVMALASAALLAYVVYAALIVVIVNKRLRIPQCRCS